MIALNMSHSICHSQAVLRLNSNCICSKNFNKMSADAAKTQKQNEKVFAEFQSLRNEQRNLANNLNTLEMDLKEHKSVIETLRTIDVDRKCFRLIGGVLCERTVKDILPQLVENKDQLEKTISIATEQLTKKGIELNRFKEEHKIRIRGQEPVGNPEESKQESEKSAEESQGNRNVLVVNN